MTAVPPPVPPEIVEKAAWAIYGGGLVNAGIGQCRAIAETVLAWVYGDIVEAARRDALREAADAIEAMFEDRYRSEPFVRRLVFLAEHPVANLATAPRTAPAATVSAQGADPRIPGTDEAQIGVQGRDLMRDLDTYRRWNEGTHLDDDYPTTGEATDAHQRIFAAVPRLLALVAAQAGQIAELTAATRPGDFLPTIRRMKRAEAKIAELEAAAEHWERVMVVVTDQAAEYVATFARVRALCDKWDGTIGVPLGQLRAALDGTEAPA